MIVFNHVWKCDKDIKLLNKYSVLYKSFDRLVPKILNKTWEGRLKSAAFMSKRRACFIITKYLNENYYEIWKVVNYISHSSIKETFIRIS